MRVSEITKMLEYDYVGDDLEISGVAYFDEAEKNDIAVIRNKNEIFKTRSEIILTRPILTPVSKTMIITYDDIGMGMKRLCDILVHENILRDYSFPIYINKTENEYYVGCDCWIDNSAQIFPNVYIGNYVTIGKNCVIEPNVIIGSGTEIGDNVYIAGGSRIGADSFYHYYDEKEVLCQFSGIGKTVINSGTRIGSGCIIQKGTISDTVVGKNCMIGNSIDIGHDVKIGENCKIVSQSGIAGNVVIKNNVMIYGQVGIANDVVVGNNVTIKAKTVVSKSVEDNKIIFGLYGRNYFEEIRIAAKIRKQYGRKDD